MNRRSPFKPSSPKIPLLKPSESVATLTPYEATSSRDFIDKRPYQTPLKLDWNESTIAPSPLVNQALNRFMAQPNALNWYPTLNSRNLSLPLSLHHQLSQDAFLVTNGSDEALHIICATYLQKGDVVLYPSPTYQHFLVFAQQQGAELRPCIPQSPFEADLSSLEEALSSTPIKLCYLVSPNNPTGVIYTPDLLAPLLDAFPHTLFVVDEAYAEFSRQSCRPLLEQYSNLVITRTFSKAYGLAGCRIGYLMAHPQVIRDLQRVFNPKSVNAFAQVAAIAALEDQAYLNEYVDQVHQSQKICFAHLHSRFKIHSTSANFFLLKTSRPDLLVHALAEEGVYVRNRSHLPGLNGFIRVSLGTQEQTEEMLMRFEHAWQRIQNQNQPENGSQHK